MVRAYILIEIAAGRSGQLVNSLKGVAAVKTVARVTGPYDVIAVLEANNLSSISEMVAEHIHSNDGVLKTTTSIKFNEV